MKPGQEVILTRGVVAFNDRVRDKERLFIQDAQNGMFVSQPERELHTRLQVGQAVRIAGPLLPGKFAPGIRPAMVNMIGWQNLPTPVIPSAEAPASSYRDGQWTEIEGVARVVIPLSELGLVGAHDFNGLWIQNASGSALSNFHVDDIALVGEADTDDWSAVD